MLFVSEAGTSSLDLWNVICVLDTPLSWLVTKHDDLNSMTHCTDIFYLVPEQ